MDEFLFGVFHRDEPVERTIKRFTMPADRRAMFDEFKDIDILDYGVSSLNRWTIGVDAVRAETAFKRHEERYGEVFFSKYFPLANFELYRLIAVSYQQKRLVDVVRYNTALNAFNAIVTSRLNGEPFAYLGRASLALQTYGLTMTVCLPQLGLELQPY